MQTRSQIQTTPPLSGTDLVSQINASLTTIASDFSGDTDPAAIAGPLMIWADTASGNLKRRNAAGTAWDVIGRISARHMPEYATVPTADQGGPVYVRGIGNMEWDGTRYYRNPLQHGQCRFVYVSATQCRLVPWNGNGIIINGRQYFVPSAGVNIANTALSSGMGSYIFAKDDGAGGIALEAGTLASSSRGVHTDGVSIKTGDPTRTLVGMAFMTSGGQFSFAANDRRVISYFNRLPMTSSESIVSASTASSSFAVLGSGINFLRWSEDMARATIVGTMVSATAGAVGNHSLYAGLNAGTQSIVAPGVGHGLPNSNNGMPVSNGVTYGGADGVVTQTARGASSTSGATITYSLYHEASHYC